MNHYEILKVKSSASQDEIKSAYKSLIKKYHPDIYPGDKTFAERKTAAINAAYDVLSNPETRAQYDSEIFSVHDCNATNVTNNTTENHSDYYKDIDPNYYANRYRQKHSTNYNTYNSYSNTYNNQTNTASYRNYTNQKFDKKYKEVREKVITYTSNLDHKRKFSFIIFAIVTFLFLFTVCMFSLLNDLSKIMNMTSDQYINNKVQEYRNTTVISPDNYYYNSLDGYLNDLIPSNSIQPENSINSYNYYNFTSPNESSSNVNVGDSPTKVLQALGSPTNTDEYTEYFVWRYPDCYVYFDRRTNQVISVLTSYDYDEFMKY